MLSLVQVAGVLAAALGLLVAADLEEVTDNGVAFPKGAVPEVLSATGAGGEGPAWDPEWGLLSSGKGRINRLATDGEESVFRDDAGTNGLLFDAEGRLLACEPKRRRVTRTGRDGTIEVLTDSYDGQPYNQPNDLTLDSKGRIYFSDACYGGPQNIRQRSADGRSIEGVYRIDAPGKVQRVLGNDDVERANGVLVSADDRFLFVADNCNDRVDGSRKLLRFALRDDGTVEPGSRQVLYDWHASRGPDGIKHDMAGRLYVAAGKTNPHPPCEPDASRPGGIYVFDAAAGRLLQFLPVPTDEVTNCGFGGADGRDLFISAGGTLYRIRTVTPGRVWWPARPEPVPIDAVRSPSASGRDPRVVVRGRVTWASHRPALSDYAAVQDDTAGIWIDIEEAKKSGVWQGAEDWKTIVPGMLVEVVGSRDDVAQTFAPQIIPESIRPLAPADDIDFPTASTTTADRLFSGVDDTQRITVEGTVQAVREGLGRKFMDMETGGRRFHLMLPPDVDLPDADALIDATIAATGVATTVFTSRGQFVKPTIVVPRGADIRVVVPASFTAFDAPAVPLERLGRPAPGVDVRHRVRTQGTVSHAADHGRLFYLQSKMIGVRVESIAAVAVRPGDVVEVAGFLDREQVLAGRAPAAGIVNAVVRVVGHGERPAPMVVQPEQIMEMNRINRTGRVATPGDYDGCLIECRARVADIRDDQWTVLPLIAGNTAFSATMTQDVRNALPALTQGCEVLIRGIVQLEFEPPIPGFLPRRPHMSLLIPSAADITVVSRPSWWTPSRLLTALALLGTALAVVLGWVAVLRREVAVQSQRLATEMAERERAAIEFDVALRERSRLAGNLHDTVLQTVTGIGYQLEACQRANDREIADDPQRLGVARQMVEHAVEQLRGTVWAMRTMPLDGKSFAAALEALAARLQAGHAARIIVHVAGIERDVPELISGNLVLLAQEAVHNALQHADANSIDVLAVFHDDSVGVVVQDDGVGFDAGSRRAAEPAGHFGLDGMRERMLRLGGTVLIESRPGAGTTVAATVPSAAADHDLSPRPVSQAGSDR